MESSSEHYFRMFEEFLGDSYSLNPLGIPTAHPNIQLAIPYSITKRGKHVLVASGFHGEELSGPYAILDVAGDLSESGLLKEIAVSFMPIACPSGFDSGKRTNWKGEFQNEGFIHTEELHDKLSDEAKVMADHIGILVWLSRDGFLSIHEDSDKEGFYMFAEEDTPIAREVLEKGIELFGVSPDGDEREQPEVLYQQRGGLIVSPCDGTLEDLLSHHGVKEVLTLEIPSKGVPFSKAKYGAIVLARLFVDLLREKDASQTLWDRAAT